VAGLYGERGPQGPGIFARDYRAPDERTDDCERRHDPASAAFMSAAREHRLSSADLAVAARRRLRGTLLKPASLDEETRAAEHQSQLSCNCHDRRSSCPSNCQSCHTPVGVAVTTGGLRGLADRIERFLSPACPFPLFHDKKGPWPSASTSTNDETGSSRVLPGH
jgi:hypothetical protein